MLIYFILTLFCFSSSVNYLFTSFAHFFLLDFFVYLKNLHLVSRL